MNENYGTNPKDVICCIGPSICQDCYEISEDVANEFINENLVKIIKYYIIKGMENIS